MASISLESVKRCALPENFSAEKLAEALKKLSTVLGSVHVEAIDPTKLPKGSYYDPPKTHDPFPLVPTSDHVASAICFPGSTEDVQSIVKIANEYKLPLWPISIGRNFGYGGAAPRVKGSLLVDLGKRMNKILAFSEEDGYVMVEPGVTYQMLYNFLQERKSNLWVDVPDLGGGSVMANTLERGGGYTPYADHFMTHSGMEIVLPTAKVIRTGMGAMPDKSSATGSAASWSTYPYGHGPYHDGIFTQSNYGIVTKMSAVLMPNPGGYQSYQISFESDEDVCQAIEIMAPLRLHGIMQGLPTIRPTILDLAVRKPKSHFSSSDAPLTDAQLDEARKGTNLGRWSLYGSLYGPKEMRDLMFGAIQKAFSVMKNIKFYYPEEVPKTDNYSVIHIRDETLQGIPSTWELNWTNFVPNGSTAFVGPVSPATSKDAMNQLQVARKRYAEYGFDVFGVIIVGVRMMGYLHIVVFDSSKPDEARRAKEMLEKIVDDATDLSYGVYRSHVVLMDKVAGAYTWGTDKHGGSIMEFNEQIKDALDPNGILAPGKSGIWPKSYRDLGYGTASASKPAKAGSKL